MRPSRNLIILYKQLQTVGLKLLNMPYGTSKAGCQGVKLIEGWFKRFGFVRVMGMKQLYIKYFKDANINLILAKVTEEMLVAGSVETMTNLRVAMHNRFEASKSISDEPVIHKRCRKGQKEQKIS